MIDSQEQEQEQTWFCADHVKYGGQESYQQRFNNFRDALTDWFNGPTRRDATVRYVENLAKRHGVNIEVTFNDATHQLNIKILPETPVVVTLMQPVMLPRSTEYDAMVEKLVERYEHKLGLFLANRLASMIRKHKAEYPNHLRICKVGDPVSEGTYADIEADGSYESCSQVFEFKHKIFGITTHTSKYKIGFNYGF